MKTFLFRSVLGIFFGAFVTVMVNVASISLGEQDVLEGHLFIKNAIGYMFSGWLFTVTPLYFKIRSIRLPLQTALHFISVTAVYFVLAAGIGWIPLAAKNILLYLLISLTIYSVMWVCFFLYIKNQSQRFNEDLKHI